MGDNLYNQRLLGKALNGDKSMRIKAINTRPSPPIDGLYPVAIREV